MPLSCSHNDGECAWYFNEPQDFTTLQTHRRKRCGSCGNLIEKGAACLAFFCWRDPITDIEERICGDEVPVARKYLCEKCGDQYMNLTALGFCVAPNEDMFELLEEYADTYGPRKDT